MTAAAGVVTVTETPETITRLNRYTCWERVVTFTLVSGDTTGAATVPINGLLQKIIIKVSNMTGAVVTPDVSLTDNGDNTIWAVTGLAESTTYAYSVNEPLVNEVNLVLAFEDPVGAGTITVTLRGV
jgi:hypothetical protein